MRSAINWYLQSTLNSYAQVFFSDNKVFAGILMLITFVDFYTGLFGLMAVLITTGMAHWMGFDKFKIKQGYYGFNSLLTGLGIGIFFQPGWLLVLIIILAAVLTLFISVAFEGIIGKYALPYLSLPFVFALWAVMLASREFQALGLNERGIYTLNELYLLGGHNLVKLYEWWGNIPFPSSVRSYFLSLGAIFFQFNVFTGVLVAIGLLVYSRIAFTLSLLGFYTAFLFYMLIGATLSETGYSYIGFNYILSAIAIGGYFIIPNRSSYLWVILLIPLVAILTISLSSILFIYQLPVYSLPFNIIALLFLYVLKFRIHNRIQLNTLFVQQNAPEKNLYAFTNFMERFGRSSSIPIHLPFFGEWNVTQGHNGEYTHKSDWKHALDFEIIDEEKKTYKDSGDFPEDYYCYNKIVVAPADGQVESIIDDFDDNVIGQKDMEHNWGNTIIIKHSERLYTKLSHLKKGSFEVKEGDRVKRGDPLARCGNSGLSPYPHLHFQVQATPYVGSKTIDYPINNYILHREEGQMELRTVDIPEKGQTISNIQAHPVLKKAFHFIPGEQIRLTIKTTHSEIGNHEKSDSETIYTHKPSSKSTIINAGESKTEKNVTETVWVIKRDLYLNTYIECERSACRAWFKSDGFMLYFTHFEGKRNTMLYYFYLGAYKICLGHYKNIKLNDTFPTNMVFSKYRLLIHDFFAPFYMYKKGSYNVQYNTLKESMSDTKLLLKAKVNRHVFNKKSTLATINFYADNKGLNSFSVHINNQLIEATCNEKRPS